MLEIAHWIKPFLSINAPLTDSDRRLQDHVWLELSAQCDDPVRSRRSPVGHVSHHISSLPDSSCHTVTSGQVSGPPPSTDGKTLAPPPLLLLHRSSSTAPPPLLLLLISHLSTSEQLTARVRDELRVSHPPSPSCFSLLALLQSYHHCVSFVHTESCTFSSPHISLIHRLITHCRPCCPPRAQKNQSSSVPHSFATSHHTTRPLSPQSFLYRPRPAAMRGLSPNL